VDIVIPFYSFRGIHDNIQTELIKSAEQIINSGNYVFGTEKFEEEFADYVGSRYCVSVSNGTAAIHLALLSLGISPGDEVITVGHTFRATVAAVYYCGAKPILIDVDKNTFTLDINQLLNKINRNTRAIIPVHMYGNACDMQKIIQIADSFNIPVIEDCSQAHGTTINKKHVGTFGKLGTFSFYPGKGLGALGDAGCIVTDDQHLYNYMNKMRSWGDDYVGFNYRMANIQAEFLRIKLRKFNEILREKRDIAKIYNEKFNYVKVLDHVDHSYHIYPILASRRDKIIESTRSQIELKIHYPIPVHKLPAYRQSVSLPITEMLAEHELSLPIYPGLDPYKVLDILNDHSGSFL
jgi:dTDP-4-amino-4,6-dideoxygalactose transaminase